MMLLPLVIALLASPQEAAPQPPNILFLFADDQRADTIAAHGNEQIVTPALDALAARGFSFRNAYCMGATQGAVCVASRAMLMSGRALYRSTGQLEAYDLLPEVFSEAGYDTFGVGKWHNGEASFAQAFEAGENVFFGGMCDHTKVVVRDLPRGGELTGKRQVAGFSSELFADSAVSFLEGRESAGDPFFLYIAFTAPHDPRQPPQDWRDHYYANRPPLPANYMPQHPFHNGWMRGRDEQLAAWPRTREVISDQLAEYYGMISHLDAQVGRILAALEASGQAENTIVVYTADHGLAMGSHGLLGKQSVYEHSMKAPMIIAGPGVPQGESAALAYLFDLYPTLCSAAGLGVPDGLNGADLLPVVRGEESTVRTQLVTAFEDKMRGIRDERWKLIQYPLLHHTQLFDLHADPDELTNLAELDEHAERVERMLIDLSRWQARFDDPQRLTVNPPQPMAYDPSSWKRKPDPWQPRWIREKYFGE